MYILLQDGSYLISNIHQSLSSTDSGHFLKEHFFIVDAKFVCHLITYNGHRYLASIWFLLRRTREKPLQATVCFSIEHVRVCHVPHDAFDCSFVCSLEVVVEHQSKDC